ncbi:MAG: hypothetical protein V3S50_12515 [Acidobacteriota bacterium]
MGLSLGPNLLCHKQKDPERPQGGLDGSATARIGQSWKLAGH